MPTQPESHHKLQPLEQLQTTYALTEFFYMAGLPVVGILPPEQAWMGIEPTIFGLRDQRLTTWPPRLILKKKMAKIKTKAKYSCFWVVLIDTQSDVVNWQLALV